MVVEEEELELVVVKVEKEQHCSQLCESSLSDILGPGDKFSL